MWDLATGAIQLSGPAAAGVRQVAFSQDGTRLAAAGFSIEVFDTKSWGRLLNVGSNIGGGLLAADFSPDGKWLASGGADRLIHLWDIETGEELLTLAGHTDIVRGVAFDSTGQRLVSVSDDSRLRVWNVMPNGFHMKPVLDVAFSPDGKRFATGDEDWNAQVWEVGTGAPLYGPLHHGGWVYRVAFDPLGGSTARLVTASADSKVRVWTGTPDPEVILSYDTAELNDVAVSPDGDLVAVASRDGQALIWNLSSRSLLELVPATANSGEVVYAVAFSPNGKLLATGGSDGLTQLWDVATGGLLTQLGGRGHGVWRATFSRDGHLVTTNYKGTVRVWDVSSNKELQSWDAHAGRATAVAFSPDGKRIATAGEDHTAKIWIKTSDEFQQDEFQQEVTLFQKVAVRALAFSPDGTWLATAGDDHEVHMYPVELRDLTALAKQRVTRQLTPDECATYLNQPC